MRRTFRLALAGLLFAAMLLAGLPARAERLPAGTELTIRLITQVKPDGNKSDDFTGVLVLPVYAAGKMVLPADCKVEGQVRGTPQKIVLSPRYLYLPDGTRVDFNAVVKDLDRKKLQAEEKEGTVRNRRSNGADTAREAAQMGTTGAAIGAMSTGSVKGMGIGAVVGVAAVVIGHKVADNRKNTYIPAGTNIVMTLARPIDIPDGADQVQPRPDRNADPDDRRPILIRRDPPE